MSLARLAALVFPPVCLHCQELMDFQSKALCEGCATLIELCDPRGRCRSCFALTAPLKCGLCDECQSCGTYLSGVAAALDGVGPGGSIARDLRAGHFERVKGGAGFLVAQFSLLGWPTPDLVTSVPQPFVRRWKRSGQVSKLLAIQVARLIGSPYRPLLRRRPGDFPQSTLTRVQRRHLSPSAFVLRKGCSIADKRLLLIDDTISTGATLRACARQLQTGWPASIYGLVLSTDQSR